MNAGTIEGIRVRLDLADPRYRPEELTVVIELVVSILDDREVSLGGFEMQCMFEERPLIGVVEGPLEPAPEANWAPLRLEHMTRTVHAVLSAEEWRLLRARLKERGIDTSPEACADARLDYVTSSRLRAALGE